MLPGVSRIDRVIGTVMASLMIASFGVFSHGRTLLLTFVPGVVFAWVLLMLHARSERAGRVAGVAPLYLLALGVQFLHFAEEYATGFPVRFPAAYGAEPFTDRLFVVFNMAAYFVFTVCAIGVFFRGSTALLLPPLFFVTYGTWGNGISHTTWFVLNGGYFPGAVTGLVHLALGPWLVHAFLGRARTTVLFLAASALVLVGSALVGFDPVAAQGHP